MLAWCYPPCYPRRNKGLSRLGEGESGGVSFFEGDQSAGEVEEGEVVLFFLLQRIRMPRFRFSQEWVASTTQRRARQPGVRAFSLISSPRARMCGT